jgi:hypothetical protein
MSGTARLTEAQRQLLAEIEEAGVLYIRRYGQYGRTAEALVRKGKAIISEPDHSRMCQDGYSIPHGPES